MEKNEQHVAVAVSDGPGRPRRQPRAELTAGDKDSDPKWSPDGRWIAFTAKRKDDEEPQIYLIAPDGGEARRLTTLATGCASLKWFPDGKRIAFVSWVWPDLATDALQAKRRKERKDAKVKAHVTERASSASGTIGSPTGASRTSSSATSRPGAAATRSREPVSRCRRGIRRRIDFDIAPDGREIAITVDLAPEPQMMNQPDIVAVDLATRRKRVLTARTSTSDTHPRYSPDGRALVFQAYDTKRSFNDQGHLVLLSRAGGAMRRLAPKLDRAATHVAWTPDSRAVLCTVEDRGRVGLARLPLDAAAPAWMARGGTVGGFAQSRDGSVIAFDRATSTHPPALFACRGDGGGERSIETLNRALLARHAIGEVREVTVQGLGRRAGADVDHLSAELRPAQEMAAAALDPRRPARRASRRLAFPLEHAGLRRAWLRRRRRQLPRLVGLRPEVARDDHRAIRRRRSSPTSKAGTDWLLRQGYIDRERLVATGGSYGGYMVAYMNGHTDRYRAFVCHAGCYDWVSMMATDGYHFFADELGAFHWDNPPRVMRQSPHHYVKRARTPTLVIHGEQDFRVPATQALQYYDTLKAKNVPARLVWFPDENHWILKPQNSRLWYREFFAWVARYAAPGPKRAARLKRR